MPSSSMNSASIGSPVELPPPVVSSCVVAEVSGSVVGGAVAVGAVGLDVGLDVALAAIGEVARAALAVDADVVAADLSVALVRREALDAEAALDVADILAGAARRFALPRDTGRITGCATDGDGEQQRGEPGGGADERSMRSAGHFDLHGELTCQT